MMSHDWFKTPQAWLCETCKACLIPAHTERWGMQWPPTEQEQATLTSIEHCGPCWPLAPESERQLERWKWACAGQNHESRKQLAEAQRNLGERAPDPVP